MKMKRLLIGAVMAEMIVTAYGQGQFLFNTHDPSFGNDVRFAFGTDTQLIGISGPDLFVQVFAGTSLFPLNGSGGLEPLFPPIPLNRTGAEAGYSNPFEQVYQVPGLTSGNVYVGYRFFEGQSLATAVLAGPLVYYQLGTAYAGPNLTVALTEPPSPPNEVLLGSGVVIFEVPEPSVCWLAVIGFGITTLFKPRCSTALGAQPSSGLS
jgi:hypothetical protein